MSLWKGILCFGIGVDMGDSCLARDVVFKDINKPVSGSARGSHTQLS